MKEEEESGWIPCSVQEMKAMYLTAPLILVELIPAHMLKMLE